MSDHSSVMTYGKFYDICDELTRDMWKLARACYAKAGLDPRIASLHANNALVSRHYGRPWENVDYDLVELGQAVDGAKTAIYRIMNATTRLLDRELGAMWILDFRRMAEDDNH